jgi:ribulose bisphosphate carboxylase small subunit
MTIFTLASFLLSGCTQSDITEVSSTYEPARCDDIIETIAVTQQIRDTMKRDFEITREFYEVKQVSETTWQMETQRWLEREEELSGDVDALFTEASTMGCIGTSPEG